MKFRQTLPNEHHLTEELVFEVFKKTSYSNGQIEKELVKEIRHSEFYIPDLDFVVEEKRTVIAHCILSMFPLSGQHDDKLLLLAPVSVSTDWQRQGVGKMMVTKAIGMATVMGFKGVIVEGDPNYYHQFGFKTSTKFGICASSKNLPPSPENLMALELSKGSLRDISGEVDYSIYNALSN